MPISPTLCILPWMHIATDASGAIRVCCSSDININKTRRADGSVYKIFDTDATDSWHSSTMTDIRKEMLEGKKPSMCKNCYIEESLKIDSARIMANKKWMFEYEKTITPLRDIKYIDIRLGNLCNLKCRMCYPGSSSKWVNEFYLVDNSFNSSTFDYNAMNWPNNNEYIHTIKKISTTIREISLTGGEPTLIEKQYELYDYLISEGLAKNIALRYNTNCTNIQPQMIEYWKKFKQVSVSLSIDAIGSLHRYIRHPAKWELVEKNIIRYKELHDKNLIHMCIIPTVQIYSIFAIDKLLDYFYNMGVTDNDIYLGMLNSPSHLNIQTLPPELKLHLSEKLKNYKILTNVIEYMNAKSSFNEQWGNFKKYTRALDVHRSENVINEIPELGKYL